MKYMIEEHKAGLDISITDVKHEKQQLLEKIRDCQEGICFCPTQEYKKLASLGVVKTEDRLELHLKAWEGEMLNRAEIEKCIAHMIEQVGTVDRRGATQGSAYQQMPASS